MGTEITIPFQSLKKKIKYLCVNLTKHVQYLYPNKHKTMMEEIKSKQMK